VLERELRMIPIRLIAATRKRRVNLGRIEQRGKWAETADISVSVYEACAVYA
jgi:hypothetical protein